ncbi:immune inhibitor A domain-containing protein [Nonomuraea sp. NPDC050310]|uniref:immune inhibitor A domain-containing protein n=1 Tax=Nonomuraea sp. NPDC050310 TaxID=3154935 RepID=UPI0033FE9BCC
MLSRHLLAALTLLAAVLPPLPAPAPGDRPPPRLPAAASPPRDERAHPEPRIDARARKQAEGGLAVSGNPAAARVLAAREAEALRTGKNPAEFLHKGAKQVKKAKVLTLLVEFNDQANDDFSGFERPRSLTGEPWDCVTEPAGTRKNGPLHNRIPAPAKAKDNNGFWVKDFSPKHYTDLLYSDRGLTTRVRPDLIDPRDGRKGVNLSGLTLKRYYQELSEGAYTITGTVSGWVRVPHSEAWYGATACGRPASDNTGHPANPLGPAQLAVDAVDALGAGFPWKDYDLEDVADADGDRNHAEPDGVIDHLQLVHAGRDKSTDGGAEGTYALWAHSGSVPGGHAVPGGSRRVSSYMLLPEDAGVGLFAHEYGHDLGLPDLYDTTNTATPDVEFWDLMSSGAHAGPLYQSMPTHLGLWGKWLLGWANPRRFAPGDAARTLTLGQSSRTPSRAVDGIRVDLPVQATRMLTPHSGGHAWWSGTGQDTADVRLTRRLQVPAGGGRFWMWNNYELEFGRDFGYVEVSADGGASWERQRVFDAGGEEVTFELALTGRTFDWRHDYVDLARYAGRQIHLRLRYVTDEAATERGWHADDFSLTEGGVTLWSDDAEQGANGWSGGWEANDGLRRSFRAYFAEWRTLDGFDQGLRHGYDTKTMGPGTWLVSKLRYNAPGLLVWLRDASYPANVLIPTLEQPPSIGVKGSLLLVDSHYEPMRRANGENLPGRVQAANAAFATKPAGLAATGVPLFTDAKTWYPGFEQRDGWFWYRDFDASVVVPARGPYSTRVVLPDGRPATGAYGTELGNGHKLGTGDPGKLAYGVRFEVLLPLAGNVTVVVKATPSGR